MRVEFVNDLVTTPVDLRYDRLVKDWRVGVARLAALVVVPQGFVYDGDSVPRIPYVYWRFKGRMKKAAALHDWLYFNGKAGAETVTRKQADLVMLDCMEAEGVPLYYRRLLYAGVRLGGWRAWRRYRRAERAASDGRNEPRHQWHGCDE